jgi:hypothetical protein
LIGGIKMKTLEELVKELGLKPFISELLIGRSGNFVVILDDYEYITCNETFVKFVKQNGYEVIEVKPE